MTINACSVFESCQTSSADSAARWQSHASCPLGERSLAELQRHPTARPAIPHRPPMRVSKSSIAIMACVRLTGRDLAKKK